MLRKSMLFLLSILGALGCRHRIPVNTCVVVKRDGTISRTYRPINGRCVPGKAAPAED